MNRKLNPEKSAAQIQRLSALRPRLGIVLGSGFNHVLNQFQIEQRIPFQAITGFPTVGVHGHAGELVFATVGGLPILVLNGRAHFYEGHSMEQVAFPVRTLAAFGVSDLLLTNAAGGINRRFRPGDFMLLKDHINLMGVNPLRGAPLSAGSGFVDLTKTYDPELQRLWRRAARRAGVKLHAGVYLAVSGPSYETPAEIATFGRLGADAVGMSTVPEAIVGRHCGLRVTAVSCITNLAAGRNRRAISHEEVLETAERVKGSAATLVGNFVELYGKGKNS